MSARSVVLAGNFDSMNLHGRRFLATAGLAALILATFPTLAAAEAEAPENTGTDDVLVLGLTGSDGEPTTLVEEEAAASAQLFRAQSSSVMTSALEVPEFSVAGLTWAGDDAPEGRIELRVRSAEGWTDWQELEAEFAEEGEIAGTEPFIVGSGTGVQVRIAGGDGTLPGSLELHLIPPNPTENDVRAMDVDELADVDVTATDESTDESAPESTDVEEPAVEPEHTEEPTDAETTVPEQPSQAPEVEDGDRPGNVEDETATEQPTEDSVPEDPETPSAPTDSELPVDGAALSSDDGAVVTTAAMTSSTASDITTAAMTSTAISDVTPAAAIAPIVPTSVERPQIISRAGWRAGDSRQIWNVPLRAAVIHHTAGTNSYTRSQSAGIVRGIQRYHMGTRGWPDIGYNFLVDKYGQVFEGRRGSLSAPPGQMPEGAHARGFNAGTMGVSVLGDYSNISAPNIAIQRMVELIAWKFDAAGINVRSNSGFISPGTAARRAGQNMPRIFAHRDVDSTTCPGTAIYRRIPGMINDVYALTKGNVFHLKNSLGGGDADLVVSRGRASDTVLVGDWNGDGTDTFAYRRGNRYYFADAFEGGALREVRYGKANDTVLVGDWDGDGRDTLAVRRGREYHIKNSIDGGQADRVVRYGKPNDTVLVGDWDGDGKDTLAVRRGHEYHIRNSLTGGNAEVYFRYGKSSDVILIGDWNGNGRDTLTVRRGKEYHVQNALRGGDAHEVFHYGHRNDVVVVGDWNGDGRDTLGVRRTR